MLNFLLLYSLHLERTGDEMGDFFMYWRQNNLLLAYIYTYLVFWEYIDETS
jgi:hypothetical protein